MKIKTKNLETETIDIIAKSKIEALDLNLGGGKLGSDGVTALCNIKTLKRLKSNPNGQILSTLANNSIPIEELDWLYAGRFHTASMNEFLKSKKDTLKTLGFLLEYYNKDVPLKNLTLCQNLEKIVIFKWHSKHLEMLSGMPKLKHLVLNELDAEVDVLATVFQRLSLKKMEILEFQYCLNAKEELFQELAELDIPANLKEIRFYQTWHDKVHFWSKNLTDNTLQALVSKCPNLKMIQFGDNFGDSNLSFKTMAEIFEKRNIFIFFGLSHNQFKMEKWLFLHHAKNVYEEYQ